MPPTRRVSHATVVGAVQCRVHVNPPCRTLCAHRWLHDKIHHFQVKLCLGLVRWFFKASSSSCNCVGLCNEPIRIRSHIVCPRQDGHHIQRNPVHIIRGHREQAQGKYFDMPGPKLYIAEIGSYGKNGRPNPSWPLRRKGHRIRKVHC